MTNRVKIKERIAAMAQELAEELGEIDDSDALSWLDALESEAVEIGDAIQAELIQLKSAEREVPADEVKCPQCQHQGRRQGMRARELIGRRGPITIHEPEYFCPCCRKAFFPADQSDRRGS
jgi:hypothetical protein